MKKNVLNNPKIYMCKIKSLTDENLFSFMLSHLTENERKRVGLKKSKQSAEASLLGILLAKTAIKQSFGVFFKDQSFAYEKKGKPYLSGYPDIHFSISHSGDYVACAACRRPIGIDLQIIRPFSKRAALRICSEAELEALLKSEQKDSDFTKLWTQKEAAVKQTGEGIFSPNVKKCLFGKKIRSEIYEDYWISICTEV